MHMMHCLEQLLHLFWDVIPGIRLFEWDNNMQHMLSGQFYVSGNNNIIYCRVHQRAQIMHDNQGILNEDTTLVRLYRASQKGMPCTAWEVKCLLKILRNNYA